MFILYSHIFDLTNKHIVPTKSTPNALLAFVQINAEYAFGIRRD